MMGVSFLHTPVSIARIKAVMVRGRLVGVSLALAGLVAACSAAPTSGIAGTAGSQQVAVTGSGKMITRAVDVGAFNSIEVGSALKTDIVRGDAFAVAITADDNVIDFVEASSSSQTLKLNMRSGSYTN